MDIKVTKGRKEYSGKVKCPVYMKPEAYERLKKMAKDEGIPVYRVCLNLMNDGLRYRGRLK